MKSLLIALIAGAALASPAFAVGARNHGQPASHHRNYDLRDVQPYRGETLPGCPNGWGYGNTQCSAGEEASDHHGGATIMRETGQRMSAFDRMTDIQDSHGTL